MKASILMAGTATAALLTACPAMAQTAAPAITAVGQARPTAVSQTPPSTEAQPNSSAQSAPAESTGLGDIIVTAQRRSESQQRAAIAVDVVTAGDLSKAGVVTATTLNAAVPSLTVQQGGGSNTAFFIRGVGNFTLNGYTDPAIAFNLDGVYLGRPTSTSTTFFDLDRIEVLKGPQGTLYGRNATGGAINVIPSRPRLGQNTLAVAAGYANYDAKDLEATANIALGSRAAFRISGKVIDRDGYNSDGTMDDVGQAVRAQLLYEPTSNLTIRLAADYSHQGGVGPGATLTGIETLTPGTAPTATSPANYTFVPSGLAPRSGLGSPSNQGYFSRQVIPGTLINPAPFDAPFLDNNYWGALAEVNWTSDLGTLTVLPSYRRSKLNFLFNGPAFQGGLQDETDDQFSLEARFEGKKLGPVDWLVGAYYFDESVNARYSFNLYQLESFQSFTSSTKSYAGFGRVTLHLTDKLRLVAGGRYTKDDKNFNASVQALINACFNPAGCFGGPSLPTVLTLGQVPGAPSMPFAPVPYGTAGNALILVPSTINDSISKGRFTYRGAAELDVAPNSLLYASYETGYRSGGFATATGHETFQPEYIEALTIGSKNRFFDNKLQINIEAFRWKYRDQQVSHFGLDSTGNPNVFTENIGRSTIQGIDAETQILVTPTTRLDGNIQYIDSKVDSFIYNTPRGPGFTPPVTGCAVSTTTAGGAPVYAVDCSGKRGFNSPTISVNAGIEQTIPLDSYKVVLTVSARYRSNSINGFEYLPQEMSGKNTTFDASASFGDADDRWSLTGFVRNITNRTINVYGQYSDASARTTSAQYAPPRTYGVRAAYKF